MAGLIQIPNPSVQLKCGVSLGPLTDAFPAKGAQLLGGVSLPLNSGTAWPSVLNRPVWDGVSTLSWVGPIGGGPSVGTDVAQSRSLTTVASLDSTFDGQVLEGFNVLGPVRIKHNNVTFRQSRVYAGEIAVVQISVPGKTGIVAEDILIDGTNIAGTSGWWPESAGGSIIRRSNIQGCENGILLAENDIHVQDCWIHDLYNGGTAHTDGIQGTGGFTAATITGNAIYGVDTSCIITQNEGAGFSGLVIHNNLMVMAGGAACFICRDDKGPGNIGSVTFTNNFLGKPSTIGASYNDIQLTFSTGPLTYTGNVDYLTGAPVASNQ